MIWSRFFPNSAAFRQLLALCLLALCGTLVTLVPAQAQQPSDSETFLYQGVLRQGGELIEGVRDLQFHLYESSDPALATALGSNILDGVTLANGIVNVKLSFDPGLFDGSERWLEVWVKNPGEVSYTVIDPRIEIVSVPYALVARAVATVGFDGNSPTNAMSVWNGFALIPSMVSEDGTTVSVNGIAVIDGNGQWIGDPTGLTGAEGAAGVDGADGVDGVDGVDGTTGAAGLSVVGAAVNTDGTLTLFLSDGTSVSTVEVVVGPAGPTGATGPQGDQGPQGEPGIQGIVGPVGVDGLDGTPGSQGDPGAAGAQGEAVPTTRGTLTLFVSCSLVRPC